MPTQDLRWLLHVCEIRLPNAEFEAESSLVDDATRLERRLRLLTLQRTIDVTRAELRRRDPVKT